MYFYLVMFYDINDEFVCVFLFDFDFEEVLILEENIKDFIWKEVLFCSLSFDVMME